MTGALAGCGSGPRIDRSLSTADQASRVRYLILHYTVTDTPHSIALFTGHGGAEVSVHYLLTDEPSPRLYGIVDENRAARRAAYETALPDAAWFQRKLADIGYVVPSTGVLDEATRNVLVAYQTRYRPARIDGVPDAETAGLLDSPMRVRAAMP